MFRRTFLHAAGAAALASTLPLAARAQADYHRGHTVGRARLDV